MDYLFELKKQGVTFEEITEEDALLVMEHQFSYYRLLEYASLFDKYSKTEKAGQFVSLDFSQLFYISLIDIRFSSLLMEMCLDIENRIKTQIVYRLSSVQGAESVVREYYKKDKVFLDKMYNRDNMEILREIEEDVLISELTLYDFLNVIQFGTLERFVLFLNDRYHDCGFWYGEQLISVRRIRNIVAHNNSLLTKLRNPCIKPNLRLCAMLGSNGIKHRTLKTNMSKSIINDITTVLQLYLENNPTVDDMLKKILIFDIDYCQKFRRSFTNNSELRSVYCFLKEVISVLCKKKGIDIRGKI